MTEVQLKVIDFGISVDTNSVKSTIDDEKKLFYAPGKSVMFNRQLQTNDGILANYVASVDHCSYTEALQKIRHYTGELSLALHENKKVTLDLIGAFSLNEEHAVQFEPAAGSNFSAASFGLSTIQASTISREVYKESVEALEEKAPILFTPERRTKSAYLKYAAVGLIAIALSGFGGMKLYEGKVQEHNFAEKQKAESLVESQIQEATFVIENPLEALNITIPKQQGRYHVIAGAFRIEANAEKKITQLASKGHTGSLIGANKYGLHQVAYSSHENRLEALQALREIKRTENKDAWLLVKDLNQ